MELPYLPPSAPYPTVPPPDQATVRALESLRKLKSEEGTLACRAVASLSLAF